MRGLIDGKEVAQTKSFTHTFMQAGTYQLTLKVSQGQTSFEYLLYRQRGICSITGNTERCQSVYHQGFGIPPGSRTVCKHHASV